MAGENTDSHSHLDFPSLHGSAPKSGGSGPWSEPGQRQPPLDTAGLSQVGWGGNTSTARAPGRVWNKHVTVSHTDLRGNSGICPERGYRKTPVSTSAQQHLQVAGPWQRGAVAALPPPRREHHQGAL